MIEKSKFYYYSFCVLFWVLCTWNFVFQEIIPGLESLESAVRMLIDVSIILLGLLTLRDRRDIIVIVSFFLISFITSAVVNKEGLVFYLNGVREYVGLVFVAPIMRYMVTNYRGDEYIPSIDRQILVFLVLQLIAVPYQAIKYGVGDHGGGTLGDGLSGTVSTLIYAGTFYLMSRNWNPDDYLRSLRENKLYILLLIPSFLNETKVSFIYFAVFFVLLFSVKLKSVLKLLAFSPVIAIVLLVAAHVYLTLTRMTEDMFLDPQFYQEYLFADDADRLVEFSERYQDGEYYELEDQWAVDLPRFFKIAQIPNILKDSKGGMLLGAGLGQLKGGSVLDKTPFAVKNEIWFRGTIPMLFNLVIQMGLIGFLWFVYNIMSVMNLKRNRTAMGLNIKLYLLFIIILQLFYGSLITQPLVNIIFFYMIFRSSPLETEYQTSDESVSPQIA